MDYAIEFRVPLRYPPPWPRTTRSGADSGAARTSLLNGAVHGFGPARYASFQLLEGKLDRFDEILTLEMTFLTYKILYFQMVIWSRALLFCFPLYAYRKKFDGDRIGQSIKHALRVGRFGHPVGPLAALHYLFWERDAEKADAFFEEWIPDG